MCLAGGLNEKGESRIFDFHEIYTDMQFVSLISYLKQFNTDHEGVKIVGHNYLNKYKTCPNFDVSWLTQFGVKNISA